MIPLVKGKINVIANVHSAYLALNQCPDSLVLSIKPNAVLKERYGVKKVVWITRNGKKGTVYPERLDFEMMEIVEEYVNSGGKCIMVDGIDYLSIINGKERVIDWIKRVKSLNKNLTLVLGVNGNPKSWSSISDFTYEKHTKMENPKVIMVKEYSGNTAVIITSNKGVNGVYVGEFGSVERFLEIGLEMLKDIKEKDVYIECTEYMIEMASEKSFVEFLKNLIDIVVPNGRKVYVKYSDRIFSSTAISLFDSLGIEEDDVFVGREKELKEIIEMIEASEKEGNALVISGEVGIGKTTLVMKAKNYALSRGFKFLYSKAYYDSTVPYLPIVEAFGDEIGTVLKNTQKHGENENIEYQRNAMFYQFTEKIKQLTENNKLFIFFDDIQWMDSSSLKLLHYLIRNLKDRRILFVCTFRREEITDTLRDVLSKMMREKLYKEIKLRELKYKDVSEMIDKIAGRNVDEKVKKMIYEYSGGNPLFVRELALNMMESIDENLGGGISIPELVKSIVSRKYDMLTPLEKRVLEVGTVYGYRIDPEILGKAVGIDEIDLIDALERISSVGIWEEDPDTGFYIFKERIVREEIYAEMSIIKRKLLHRKIAKVMEKEKGHDEKYLVNIARHYKLGEVPEKAYEYFINGAARAKDIYAYEDALEIYMEAKELNIDDEKLEFLYSELGELHRIMGEYAKSISDLENALKIARATGNKNNAAEYLERMGRTMDSMGKWDEAKDMYYNALSMLSDENSIAAKIYLDIAWMYIRRSKLNDAIKYAKKGADIAISKGFTKEEADAYHVLGTIYEHMMDFESAYKYFMKAMKIREKINDLYGLATDYNNLGATCDAMGKLDDALENYKNALKILDKIGYVYSSRPIVLTNIGNIYAKRENLHKAVEYYLMSLSISEMINDWFSTMLAYMNIGVIYATWGMLNEAMDYFKKALNIAKEQDDKESIADLYRYIGNIHYFRGKFDDAYEFYMKAMELYESINSDIGIGETKRDIATLMFASGNEKEAVEDINESLKILSDINCKECLYESHITMAEIMVETKNYNEAMAHAKAALEIAEEEKSKIMKINPLRLIGKVMGLTGDVENGEKYIKEAIKLSEKTDIRRNYALSLMDMGLIKLDSSIEEGINLLKSAKTIFKELGFEYYVSKITKLLGKFDNQSNGNSTFNK